MMPSQKIYVAGHRGMVGSAIVRTLQAVIASDARQSKQHALLKQYGYNVNVARCLQQAPIDKPTLLAVMQKEFGLQHEIVQMGAGVNATGGKPHYYSLNTRAAGFGYFPALTSLQGVLEEAAHALTPHPIEYRSA
jgi:nucleoside-diphosphate-sugar epimerase